MAANNLKLLLIMILTKDSVAVSDYCGALPEIPFSTNNMSGIHRYKEGVTARFSCWSGYASAGKADYACTDGNWVGGPFSCMIRKCSLLGSPINGDRIGESHEVGSVMRFKCHTGFELVGSPTMLCKANAVWNPLNIPYCRRKRCPTIPLIRNGTVIVKQSIDGQSEVFGAILKAKCHERFIRNGPANIYCTEKGQWTAVPTCEYVSCPPFPGLDSNCVSKSKLYIATDNTLLFIYCTENSTMTGNWVAACNNNEWDDVTLGCWCDCSIKADNDLVQFENLNSRGLLTHGENLTWSCKDGYKRATTKHLTCVDGSVEKPVCDPDIILTTRQNDSRRAMYVMWGILVTVGFISTCIFTILWRTCRKKCYPILSYKERDNIELEDSLMVDISLDQRNTPNKDDVETIKELKDTKSSCVTKAILPVVDERESITSIDLEEARQNTALELVPVGNNKTLLHFYLKSNARQFRQPISLMNKARPLPHMAIKSTQFEGEKHESANFNHSSD